jgi:hypothetical protein
VPDNVNRDVAMAGYFLALSGQRVGHPQSALARPAGLLPQWPRVRPAPSCRSAPRCGLERRSAGMERQGQRRSLCPQHPRTGGAPEAPLRRRLGSGRATQRGAGPSAPAGRE